MKSRMWKRSVPLAVLALAVTIVVLVMPGRSSAAGATFLQRGYTLWTDGTNQVSPCTECYVRIVDNNTGGVVTFRTGDSYSNYSWGVWLTTGHEYHFYVQYEGHFCAALSRPYAPYNIDWPPNTPYSVWTQGGLLEPSQDGAIMPARELDYIGTPTSPCPE